MGQLTTSVISKKSDQWGTPPTFVAAVLEGLRISQFCIDVASPQQPRVPCRKHYTGHPKDGLIEPWDGQANWCNPPYSNVRGFVSKALAEHRNNRRKLILMLIPNAPETVAFDQVIKSDAAIIEIIGRLKFVDLSEPTRRLYPARFPSALCVWGATKREIRAISAALARRSYRNRIR